jgi:cellulose biosynthesis protein BcsQ
MIVFAADAARWYEDFGFWASFLTVVGGIASGAWFLARYFYHRQVVNLTTDLAELKAARNWDHDELRRQLQDSRSSEETLRQDLDESRESTDKLQTTIDRLKKNLQLSQQMKGLTWRAMPTGDAPPFVPLRERRVPVVAVLNLKGGVGKTTLTANLGAAFARDGWRMLLVDLDLQASLTSLFVSGEQLQNLSDNRRLIQHYFEQAMGASGPQFGDFVHACSEHRVELVGSADTLAYAELNMSVRWLLQPNRGDPRLLLRDALHGKALSQCDLALIDCPPLLNISCINALAAADFLVVPIVPSKSSTDRVPAMLSWLRTLRQTLNPDLKILGVVANRTGKGTGLLAEEANLWAALRRECHDVWGEEPYMCETFIPQRVDVRNAENERRPLNENDGAFEFFGTLAKELAGRLPHASRRAAVTGAAS